MALGLLMQSLFDPQITDWEKEAKQNMEILMSGMSRSNP
jgi:hypothetical protein